MVAPLRTRKIFCTVVRVSGAEDTFMRSTPNRITPNRINSRPSEMLPWADPTIARLVAKLQNEVRDERTQTRTVSQISGSRISGRISGMGLAELEPPTPRTDNDWNWNEEPRWSKNDES